MNFKSINLENEKLEIKSDGEFNITGLVTKKYDIEEKVLSYTESVKYIEPLLSNKQIAAIVCTKEVAQALDGKYYGGICISENARSTFFKIHNYMVKKNVLTNESIIAQSAKIHPTAIIDSNNVIIGENTVIGAYSVIKENTKIGNNVVIMENCVVGAPGFYYYDNSNEKTLVESAGGVTLEENVVLHPSTTICKGVFGKDTVLEKNVKIDSHVFIAHDVAIKENTLIAAGCILAGYTEVGENSFFGVGTATTPLVSVGNDVLLSAGSIVTKKVPSETHFSGNFAIEHNQFINNLKRSLK